MSVTHGRLIMAVASLQHLATEFQVPPSYDYKKSTNDNYKAPGSKFYGKHKEIRASLDYSYHVNYVKSRQLWQDAVIETVVSRDAPQENPWIVYTCGAMGAGKGYTMRWMSAHGYFPLENVVRIDPDHFKNIMPEWEGYVRENKFSAGAKTHRESGYLQEISQEVALRSRRNIWVDGSLKDGAWFSKVFDDIRRRYSLYKIGIFYIYADEDQVKKRVKERGRRTGRYVSEDDIKLSLRGPEKSLNMLTSKVDFIARIDNTTTPILRSFEVVDRCGCWGRIQQYATNTSSINTFPNYLKPMALLPTEIDDSNWVVTDAKKNTIQIQSATKDTVLRSRLKHLDLVISPSAHITFKGKSRSMTLIPEEATSFAFIYPSEVLKQRWNTMEECVRAGVVSVGVAHLYQNGGFVYFNNKGKVESVTMIVSASTHRAQSYFNLTDDFHQRMRSRIQFHNPYVLPSWSIKLIERVRWRKVQRPDMRGRHCKYFAWIKPREFIAGHRNPYGAFAYIFHDPDEIPTQEQAKLNRFFPIISAA